LPKPKRRDFLAASAAATAAIPHVSLAAILRGNLPWTPAAANPPSPVDPNGWRYFNPTEVETVEAIVDRLIPPDPETPGGKDANCAVFIDRQLAGPYGTFEYQYRDGPFQSGTPEQGNQSPLNPQQEYRIGLAALDKHCQQQFNNTPFSKLSGDQQDQVLKGLEDGSIKLEGVDSKSFFAMVLMNTQQGFFADPIYGGNKDMCAWKMIGFPGAIYDYRDWIHRHNEPFPHPPVGIANHPDWKL
jgi:gluconate 2-dehydrogenase gamma chain